MPSAQIALIQRLYNEFWNEQDLAVATRAAISIYHHPDQYVNEYKALWATFPDLRINPDLILEDGNHVAVRWSLRGTQRGVFRLSQVRIPATGLSVVVLGISIFEVSDGLISSGIWATSDALAMLQHLGVRFLPPAPTAPSSPRSRPHAPRTPRTPRGRRTPDTPPTP